MRECGPRVEWNTLKSALGLTDLGLTDLGLIDLELIDLELSNQGSR
jgi:hypothetical protein